MGIGDEGRGLGLPPRVSHGSPALVGGRDLRGNGSLPGVHVKSVALLLCQFSASNFVAARMSVQVATLDVQSLVLSYAVCKRVLTKNVIG